MAEEQVGPCSHRVIKEVTETKTRRLLTFRLNLVCCLASDAHKSWFCSTCLIPHQEEESNLNVSNISELQDLDVIPDLLGDNASYLLKEWNFIQVSVSFCFKLKWKHVHKVRISSGRLGPVWFYVLFAAHVFLPVWSGSYTQGVGGSESSSSPPTGCHLGECILGFYSAQRGAKYKNSSHNMKFIMKWHCSSPVFLLFTETYF